MATTRDKPNSSLRSETSSPLKRSPTSKIGQPQTSLRPSPILIRKTTTKAKKAKNKCPSVGHPRKSNRIWRRRRPTKGGKDAVKSRSSRNPRRRWKTRGFWEIKWNSSNSWKRLQKPLRVKKSLRTASSKTMMAYRSLRSPSRNMTSSPGVSNKGPASKTANSNPHLSPPSTRTSPRASSPSSLNPVWSSKIPNLSISRCRMSRRSSTRSRALNKRRASVRRFSWD